jgi:hypothetical protein
VDGIDFWLLSYALCNTLRRCTKRCIGAGETNYHLIMIKIGRNSVVFLSIIFLFGLEGCQEEKFNILEPISKNAISEEISVERAKVLYDSSLRSLGAVNARRSNQPEAPDWERPKRLKFMGGQKALVIPIFEMPESATLTTIGAIKDRTKLTQSDLITPVQLIVYRNKEGKEVVERMYTKTDRTYLKQKQEKSEDKDFTGMHWFEDNEGHFKRAFVYENGELIKSLIPEDVAQSANLRTTCGLNLYSQTIDYYSTACSSYGCGPPQFMYSQTFSYYVADRDCEQNKHATEFAPTGGGGGGSNNNSEDRDLNGTIYEGWAVPEDRISQFNAWLLGLNPKESAWVKANKQKAPAAWWNSTLAKNFSQAEYMCLKDNGFLGDWIIDIDGTNQNAFKHAYWNALNYNSFGESEARVIGENHEGDWKVKTLDIDMDLQNNELGIKIAQTCGCAGSKLKEEVLKAIRAGRGQRNSIGSRGVRLERLVSTSNATSFCDDF